MGGGLAEIGHAPPDHETAERGRSDGDAYACKGGADQKIVKHQEAFSREWS